jgi:hypothetical protein
VQSQRLPLILLGKPIRRLCPVIAGYATFLAYWMSIDGLCDLLKHSFST